ncbi:hypothetical protein ERJ75_001665200 [Trypanosoma vivax]|uniref:Putative EF-hand protein n=1 Tax=Trypanosoma vivax (strain Y486) TaxID=1055687 RepID=G0U8H8_TRYVY|nr:putative EF-hand protein [Trypanosoma vivax]KAH8604992.1 hypothetical protein ERJ75_001665200 [Trypanosoma vivax]CCC53904.1 putative EF-hand protein [Trypanosoma vivax Y486]
MKGKAPSNGQVDRVCGGAGARLLTEDVRGISRPIYRRAMTHNTIAELAEGFRVLSGGQKTVSIPVKDVYALVASVGLHISEEDFHDAMRVFAQRDQPNLEEFSFRDFLSLMTCEVDDGTIEELRSTFFHFDKQRTGFVSRKQFIELFATCGERSTPDELTELLSLVEQDELDEKVDYNRFVNELALRLNQM